MAQSSKEPVGKKEPSAKTLNELMELLLKLNSKLRKKVSPHPGKKEAGEMEMVIIILNSSSEPAPKNPRPEKRLAARNTWIDDLCREIERGAPGRKGSI